MRHLSDDIRRSRIARRHALAPDQRRDSPEAATRAMTALHATEPASVHLALHARVVGLGVGDVARALERDRTLVKQLAMRRTLFVLPRDLLPAAWGSASARVAAAQRTRLIRELSAGGPGADPAGWLREAERTVLERLGSDGPLTAAELRSALPALDLTMEISPSSRWGGSFPVLPRVLTQLGLEGLVVRGENAGHWRVSRPRWASMESWLGELPAPWPAAEGYAELVGRWLATFGPGTVTDLQWWLGGTQAIVRRALEDVGAVRVGLDDGGTGWVLPGDDSDEPEHDGGWAALLPVLDPTVMGWKERGFYLGGHAAALFDRNGNAGTTAWWDGRVVGCWVQDEDGVVTLRLLEELPAAGREALEAEAERLTGWLAGERVGTVYPSPAMRAAG